MISSACRCEEGTRDVPVCKLQLTNDAGVMISKTDSKIARYKLHNERKQADSNVLAYLPLAHRKRKPSKHADHAYAIIRRRDNSTSYVTKLYTRPLC